MNAPNILALLWERYTRREWLFFAELRVGTGYGKDAETRLDAWTMAPTLTHRFERITYEVKTTRADFLTELREPRKRRLGLLLSNHFYFITPPGVARPEEIPAECGLIEISLVPSQITVSQRANFETIVTAPWRDVPPPSLRFLAALVRRAQQSDYKAETARWQQRVCALTAFPSNSADLSEALAAIGEES